MVSRCHNVLCMGEGVLLVTLSSSEHVSLRCVATIVAPSASPAKEQEQSNQTVTYKGTCEILDDDETKAWFYPALASNPADEQWQKTLLDF